MITQLNNTLMRFLTLGLVFNIILISSCSKKFVNPARDADFHFINMTDKNISYEVGLEKFNLKPSETITIGQSQDDSGLELSPSSYSNPFRELMTPQDKDIIIKFNVNKCWTTAVGTDHSPLDIKNYTSEKLGERKYKFTYTFTEADYNRAITCP
jgi:hypothetical protein